jgi:ADP-ribose pyrophosphatase YjhB (NUDIX family)
MVVAAGALITYSAGVVLLVKPCYKQGWEVPGGCVEVGESAREACVRELIEELGHAIPVGRLLVIEHQTLPDDKGDSIMLVYDGGVLSSTDGLTHAAGELEAMAFIRPEHLSDRLPLRQARRMAAALRARADGRLAELENGVEWGEG